MKLYDLIRPPATVGLTVYFRKIYFTGKEHIPTDKPILLAANHPTAFLDPCLLACFQPRKLHFLARGDFFINKWISAGLRSLHIIPIFRLKDGGYSSIKRNYATFARCFEYLQQQKAIMILAEGGTAHEKRLRPLKKGTARIAFGTLQEQPDLDLQIVPIGINYTYADRYRSQVMIQCAPPISVQSYWEHYQTNPRQATRALLTELRKRMVSNMIIIEKEADEPLAEQLFRLVRNEQPARFLPLVSEESTPLRREQAVCMWLNQASELEKQNVGRQTEQYRRALRAVNVSDYGLQQLAQPRKRVGLVVVLGSLPFAIGYLGNYLPLRLGKWIGTRTAPHITFYSSITAVSGMLAWIFYYLSWWLFTLVVPLPIPTYWIWILLVLLPFLGYFALYYQHTYRYWKAVQRAKKLSPTCQTRLLQLRPVLAR
ncbi:MAG: 1-acyl-sn-glycerol-3-phosphate acyltransferase [Bacteroidota bacterium]